MWFDSRTHNDRRHHPATARYANRQSGEAQTLVTCGFDSHPCYFGLFLVPWSSGNDSSLTKRKRGFDSLRDDWISRQWSVASGQWPVVSKLKN